MAYPNFPYTDFHRLNADWILKTVRACAQKVKEAAQTVETYADRLLQVEIDVTLLQGAVNNMQTAVNGSVRYDISQNIDAANQMCACTNIKAVCYGDLAQLPASQATQARFNINAPSVRDVEDVSNVATAAQNTANAAQTTANAAQTAANAAQNGVDIINAGSELIVSVGPNELGTDYESSHSRLEIMSAYNSGRKISISLMPLNSETTYYGNVIIDESSETISSYLFTPADPASSVNSELYRVVFMLLNGSEYLGVTKNEARLVPAPQNGDTGKILKVGNYNRPVWADDNIEIVYATLNTTTGVCTPGEGFTFNNLHNNRKIVFAYVTAQNNYIYRFMMGTDRPTRVVFNNVSIYPAGNEQTKYDMFITIDNNDNIEYIRNSETFTPS